MIDTLGIWVKKGEFDISDKANLQIYPATYNLSDGEVTNDFHLFDLESGGEVTGSKAILNTDRYNITLDSRGLFLHTSVPKYLRGSNYITATKSDTMRVVSKLYNELEEEGIKVNKNQVRVGRIDTCKNAPLDKPTGYYFSFMQSLNGSRLKDKTIHATGLRWQNSLAQIVAYDKREEMTHRKVKLNGIPKNVIRFENRLMKGSKIRQVLGVDNTVNEVLKNYKGIEENYYRQLKKEVFKYKPDDKRLFEHNTVKDYLYHSLKNRTRNWFLHFSADLLFSKEGLVIDLMKP